MAEPTPKVEGVEQGDYTPLDAFGLEIARKRREAIDGRALLGIEDEWLEDEEAYIGVDDANRSEYRSTWRNVKPSQTGGTWSTEDAKRQKRTTRSTAFVNITRPYVDAATARMSDMLLPNDDKCWGIEPTPIPNLQELAQQQATGKMMVIDEMGTEVDEAEFAKIVMEVAQEHAERAEKRIEDWFSEGKWHHKARGTIEDAARIGTGIIKGPFPRKKRIVKWEFKGFRSVKTISHEILPVSEAIDPWNAYPDPGCGEDIQDGDYFFERDTITKRRLLNLRGTPGYITQQIDAAIAEGPIKPEAHWTPSMQEERTRLAANEPFEIWYYYGMVAREELESAQLAPELLADGASHYSAIITMVNHRVIKAALSPLDDGTFPYDFMVWQRRPGMPWGIGVARQVRVPQRMLNAAVRNMMDNAAISGGPQIVIDTSVIVPLDGNFEIVPRKVWVAKDGAEMIEVDKAFRVINIDCRQEELERIIHFALRMGEEATGLPMILQGQMGEKGPETLGGMKILQNNASAVLRRLAKLFDMLITVPHVERYYHWLMEYGKDDAEKGDYQIIARGSSTLVERDLQNQELAIIAEMSGNPVYGLDPAKTAEEYLRSRRFDPDNFKPDPEDVEAAANEEPEVDPRVQAAAIQAENKAEIAAADREADLAKTVLELEEDAEKAAADRVPLATDRVAAGT